MTGRHITTLLGSSHQALYGLSGLCSATLSQDEMAQNLLSVEV